MRRGGEEVQEGGGSSAIAWSPGSWGRADGAQGSEPLYCSFAPLTSYLNMIIIFLLFRKHTHIHLLFWAPVKHEKSTVMTPVWINSSQMKRCLLFYVIFVSLQFRLIHCMSITPQLIKGGLKQATIGTTKVRLLFLESQ